jgi:hypothetical protein
MSKMGITPMKRRVAGYSRTASQGITDVVVEVDRRTGTLSKFKAIRLLKAAGVKKHRLLR